MLLLAFALMSCGDISLLYSSWMFLLKIYNARLSNNGHYKDSDINDKITPIHSHNNHIMARNLVQERLCRHTRLIFYHRRNSELLKLIFKWQLIIFFCITANSSVFALRLCHSVCIYMHFSHYQLSAVT